MPKAADVMAFRKRMKHKGYTDIHIYALKDKPLVFLVSAVEPACKCKVSAEIDFRTMPKRCK